MRIVAGVDWTDEACSGVEEVLYLYAPSELVLVHAVNLGALESHALVPSMEQQAYDDIRQAKQTIMEAARRRLNEAAARVSSQTRSVKSLSAIGSPAGVILDTASSEMADLVAVGHRGLGLIEELMMGSVSHRVLLNATRSTLIVKGRSRKPRRILVAIKGAEDTDRIQRWLLTFPFRDPVGIVVVSVVPTGHIGSVTLPHWNEAALKGAQWLVKGMATSLTGPHYAAIAQVLSGNPVEIIAQLAGEFDLLVVSSHGRKGVQRFMLGSVSHSLIHHVACPTLVVR